MEKNLLPLSQKNLMHVASIELNNFFAIVYSNKIDEQCELPCFFCDISLRRGNCILNGLIAYLEHAFKVTKATLLYEC